MCIVKIVIMIKKHLLTINSYLYEQFPKTNAMVVDDVNKISNTKQYKVCKELKKKKMNTYA